MNPRVLVNLPAVVSNRGRIDIEVVLHDLSLNGTSFRCSTAQRDQITPGGVLLRGGKPIEVAVKFGLSGESVSGGSLSARCAVVYSRRLAVDRCQIGMRFVDMDERCRQQLQGFIDVHLKNGAANRTVLP